MLLLEDRGQNVIGLLRCTLELFFMLINLGAENDLLLVRCESFLLLLPLSSLMSGFLIQEILEYALESVSLLLLLLLSEVLDPVVLLDLLVSHKLLLLKHLPQSVLLLPLLTLLLLLLIPDVLEVFKVTFLFIGFSLLVLVHLFLQLDTHPQLILPDLHLNRVLLLLELFNIVHNNLRPVVWVLRRGCHVRGAVRAQDLVANILDGRGAGSLGGVRQGLEAGGVRRIDIIWSGTTRVKATSEGGGGFSTEFNKVR